MNNGVQENDSEIIKFCLHLPVRIGIILYFFVLPFSDFFSEALLWISCSSVLVYILIKVFSKEKKHLLFFLGGEITLFLFLLALLGSLYSTGNFTVENLFHFRWVFFLYLITYIFDIFPSLNHRVFYLVLSGTIIAAYALIQSFSPNLIEIPGLQSYPIASPWPHYIPYVAQGFFEQKEFFGIFLAMILGYPMGAWFFHKRMNKRIKVSLIIFISLFTLAIAFTFSTTAWAAWAAILATNLFLKRKFLLILLVFTAMFMTPSLLEKTLPKSISEKITQSEPSSVANKRLHLQESLKLFKKNIWLGTGFRNDQNSAFSQPPPNTYFYLLSSTGLIGFLAYMLFCLNYLFMVLQLWQEMPPTHSWHRAILAGSLGSQVTFHLSGVYIWSFGQNAIFSLFIISLALTAYLSERYSRGIVSDDYSL